MGSDSRPSSSSPRGKRTRDPEDEVYLDNLRSQKRYLSEIMACSLNGLTVGDSLPVTMLDSPPVRSETFLSPNNNNNRDDLPLQYSPMSEDSDEARFCEDPASTSSSQPESRPTSPVSPYRYQRPSLTSTNPSSTSIPHTCTTTTTTSTPLSRPRGSDTEGRFPSSPSDICHSGDLRRTALLRSVQMRTQPCTPHASSSGQSIIDGGEEERMCIKSMEEDNRGEDTSYTQFSSKSKSYTQFSSKSKSCKALDM